jgi:monoamine oxidase
MTHQGVDARPDRGGRMLNVSAFEDSPAVTATTRRARPLPPRASTEVAVVGAGLAGLVAAYELRKRGIRTRVLEAAPFPGGRVATVDYGDGLYADAGLQEIWANNPLLSIAAELGLTLEERCEHGARSAFLHRGRLVPELTGTDGLAGSERRALDDWIADACALRRDALVHGLAAPRVGALQDVSGRDWLEGSGLSPRTRSWLRLHAEAELGTEWERCSALYALLEMECFFERALGTCYTVAGGNGRLIEALAAACGPVALGARVTRIDRAARAGLRVLYVKERRLRVLDAERVVVAVPFHAVPALDLDLPLSAAHWQAIRTLRAGHYAPVHLVVDRPSAGVQGFLTNGPLGYVYGVVAENEDRAVFSLLPWGRHARAFHAARGARLRAVVAGLERIRPGLGRRVRAAHVYTHAPAAVPLWAPGRSPVDGGSALLRQPVNGLHFAGDYLYGAHADAAVRSGIAVARRIAGKRDQPFAADGALLVA